MTGRCPRYSTKTKPGRKELNLSRNAKRYGNGIGFNNSILGSLRRGTRWRPVGKPSPANGNVNHHLERGFCDHFWNVKRKYYGTSCERKCHDHGNRWRDSVFEVQRSRFVRRLAPTWEPLARRPFKNHKLAAGGAPVRRLTGATLSHLTQRSVNRDSGHFSPDPALSESIKFPLTRPQESNIFMSSA